MESLGSAQPSGSRIAVSGGALGLSLAFGILALMSALFPVTFLRRRIHADLAGSTSSTAIETAGPPTRKAVRMASTPQRSGRRQAFAGMLVLIVLSLTRRRRRS